MTPIGKWISKSTLIIPLCLISLGIQVIYRIPSGPLFLMLLPLISLTLVILSTLILVDYLLPGFFREWLLAKLLRRLERGIYVLVGVLVAYSGLLLVNGRLDTSVPVDYSTEVVRIVGEEIALGKIIPVSWIEVRSWEDSKRTVCLLLRRHEQRAFWVGEPLVVQVRQGYLNVPWVFKLERDESQYARNILKKVPTAAEVWHNLIEFYLRHERWEEASAAAQDYLKIYPNDYEYASYWATLFGNAGHYVEGLRLLEPFFTQQRTFEDYVQLGNHYEKVGNVHRAIECFETAIVLQPDNFLGYYYLGYAHQSIGERTKAMEMFEKALERQPNFPEIEEQIATLRRTMEADGNILLPIKTPHLLRE